MTPFVVLVILFSKVCILSASTHWIVTEDGRIQAHMDSIFHLRRPDDFISLTEQEKRAVLMDSLRQDLVQQKEEIDKNEDKNMNLDSKFYLTDPDCILASQPLTEIDLYVSTVLKLKDEIENAVRTQELWKQELPSGDMQQPHCETVYPLDFSMHAFEHLNAMRQRNNLSMSVETGIMSTVIRDENVSEYGHKVAIALHENITSWVLYNMAAFYWRIQGNAYEAVECLRRALQFSPREHRNVALLSLGNLLHHSHHSEEAAIVLHAAVDHDTENAMSHFTLGNVYVVLADYNRSIGCLENTLHLQPQFETARKTKHAVLCHSKLESALEQQHESLQNTLKGLQKYQKHHEMWQRQLEKILREQAPLDVRLKSKQEYEEHKIRSSKDGKGQDCFQYQQNGHMSLSCNTKQEVYTGRDLQKDMSLDLQSLLDDVKNQAEKLSEQVGKKKKNYSKSNTKLHEKPTKPVKYFKLPVEGRAVYLQNTWPSQEECEGQMSKFPQWNEFPTVFLSPENKGFEVSNYLSEFIDLREGDEHPLPWRPPVCQKLSAKLPWYDSLPSVEERDRLTTQVPDLGVKEDLLRYGTGGKPLEAEVGQRIVTALAKNAGPSWLLYNMAGLYWRIRGNAYNGVECMRHSLHTVPREYKDVVLVNLGALLYKVGHIDDALQLLKEAISINNLEPVTNFFLANLYSAKGNLSGAIHHYKRALRMEPDHPQALNYLRILSCYVKYKASKKWTAGRNVESQPMCQNPPPSVPPNAEFSGETIICTKNDCYFSSGESLAEQCQAAFQCYTAKNDKGAWVFHPATPDLFSETELGDQCTTTLEPPSSGDTEQLSVENLEVATVAEMELNDVTEDEPAQETNIETKEPDPSKSHWKITLKDGSQETVDFEDNDSPIMNIEDDPLPDILLRVHEKVMSVYPTQAECDKLKMINWQRFTSTWLSVSAKNVDIRDYLEPSLTEPFDVREPFCDANFGASMHTLDHLAGVKHRNILTFSAELGLKEAFQTLAGEEPRSIEEMATRIAMSLDKNSTSWVATTAAALYWRVTGNAEYAVNCLRLALHFAPREMKDIPLISLANILHRAGLYNDALIVTNMALEISPKFVVIHFTMANIYAVNGDIEMAIAFYQSTLALQSSFEPARDRLYSIMCTELSLGKLMEGPLRDTLYDMMQ